MGATGTELGVDLYELWDAGNALFPAMAGEIGAASDGTSGGAVGFSFYRGGDLGIGSTGPHPEWSTAAGTLSGYLAETERNLRDVGTALILAANTYAAEDAEAQAELERRKQAMD